MNKQNNAQLLEKLIQVLPKDIFEELKKSAEAKTRSLNEEIAIRLYTAMHVPQRFEINDLITGILNHKFSRDDVQRELEYYKQCKMYQYEIDKMEFLIRYEDAIAKDFFSDKFTLISMEVEGKAIRKRLRQEKRGKK